MTQTQNFRRCEGNLLASALATGPSAITCAQLRVRSPAQHYDLENHPRKIEAGINIVYKLMLILVCTYVPHFMMVRLDDVHLGTFCHRMMTTKFVMIIHHNWNRNWKGMAGEGLRPCAWQLCHAKVSASNSFRKDDFAARMYVVAHYLVYLN